MHKTNSRQPKTQYPQLPPIEVIIAQRRFVAVDVPSHVVSECFCYGVCFLGEVYGDVVLESHFADVLHEVLEVGYFHDAVAAEGLELVVRESAVAGVCGYDAGGVVGGRSAECCPVGGDSAGYGSVGAVLADGSGDDCLVVHLRGLEEGFWEVGAVEEDAFVGVCGVVVVPVEQCAGCAGG